MLLAIDIGNTDTVVGVFDDKHLLGHFRVASRDNLTLDECGLFITGLLERMKIPPERISRVIIASVVPRLTPTYQGMAQKYFGVEALIVSHKLKLPITIAYDDPSEVGADRIANTAAGFTKFGGPLIVVDFGTATTFDVIDKNGRYLGGVITPGPVTSGAELARKAARLFEVDFTRPDKVIGTNTVNSIRAGLFFGTIGQVEFLIRKIAEELGEKPQVIATGGLAGEFEKNSAPFSGNYPTLTLEGLQIIAALNK